MSMRVEIDGKFYRKREGKWVEIPKEWVGKTVDQSTKRRRKRHKDEPKDPYSKGRYEYFDALGLEIPFAELKNLKYINRKEAAADKEITLNTEYEDK